MKNKSSFIKKSSLLLATGFLLLSSFSSVTRQDQPAPETVVVTLNVDTGQITKDNMATTCDFGQPDGVSNEDFTIEINVGDVITWQGVSSTSPSTDVVDIVKIRHARGKNIFGKDLDTGDKGRHQKVSGKALARTTDAEGHYKYEVHFTVTNNGVKRNGIFKIDPVIQVH